MELLEALIFRKLMKAYLPRITNTQNAPCALDVLETVYNMMDSANETIKESGNDIRELYKAREEALDLMAEASSQGF